MRKLVVLVFGAALFWAGYWFVGSGAVEKGLTVWLDDRQSDGWLAEYGTLNTRGFPNRFDTIITDLELADPRTGVALTLPELQILALSYKPNHIIAVLPPTQTLTLPRQTITITNDKMRGSVVFDPDTALTLNRSSFELVNFDMTSDQGTTTHVRSGKFDTRQSVAVANSHDIAFKALGVAPTKKLLSALDPAGLLPDVFEALEINTTIVFDAPWDRFAIEQRRPQITSLDLKLLRATWGDLDLQAAGELSVDAAGQPNGAITIKAQNWREMLQVAVAAGLVPTTIAPTVERALELLASMSGNPETLDAPLSFQNGRMSFGPIPLGPAPRLILR